MPKVDKSQYTKSQWKRIKEQRRRQKALERSRKAIVEHQIIRNPNSKIAFVIGNGTSRQGIELASLNSLGPVYACNAVYRTYQPDYLIAVDTKMVLEIAKAGYQLKNEVWTNYNKTYEKLRGFNYFEPSLGWSSGPTALNLASEHGYETIYILGFDYKGTSNDKVNNIFADTPNYKKSTDKATYFGNWLRQTGIVIQKNPKIRYIRVLGENEFIPEPFSKLPNIEHISMSEFLKIVKKDSFEPIST